MGKKPASKKAKKTAAPQDGESKEHDAGQWESDELGLAISLQYLSGKKGAAAGKGGKAGKPVKKKNTWNAAGTGKRAMAAAEKRAKEAEEKVEFVNPTPKGQMKGAFVVSG